LKKRKNNYLDLYQLLKNIKTQQSKILFLKKTNNLILKSKVFIILKSNREKKK